MKVNIEETFALGNQSEAAVKSYYEQGGWCVKKKDHKLFPYDFDMCKEDKLVRVEVKTFGHPTYTTLFAETEQVSAHNRIVSIPEYLTHKDEIDFILWVDRLNNKGYIFKNKTFADYILMNKHKEFYNKYSSGKGILIERDCQEAGYVKTINL